MKFKTTLEKFESNLWGYHIPVPNEIVEKFIQGDNKRIVLKINEGGEVQCAFMPDGNGGWFINVNKELRKKLNLKVGQEVNAEIQKDESKYGLPMPEEMLELLQIDDEGNKIFHELTPGKQRSLLFIIGKPKNSDTRLRKALMTIDYLKEANGKLDFKELNTFFKDRKEDY